MEAFRMINILFYLVLLTILLFSVLYYYLKKQIRLREGYTIYLFGKKKVHNFYLELYEFFSKWRVTRRYIKSVSKSLLIYHASKNDDISIKTMKLIFKTWALDLFLIVFIYLRNPSVFTFFLFIMYLLITNKQMIYVAIESGNIRLLKQFDLFLGEVRHNFQIHKMIDEAIFDALRQTPNPMQFHGQKIYEILDASDMQEEVSKYNETTSNRFLKLFLSLCVMMVTYGDKEINKNSLFLINIKYLRQEVNIEILHKERIKHMFSGLISIAVVPILFLKVIENWAIQSLPEIESYYKSLYGILTATTIFLITYASYVLLNRLKESQEFETKNHVLLEYLSSIPLIHQLLTPLLHKNYGKTLRIKALLLKAGEGHTNLQFFLKRILYGIFGFLLCTFLSVFIHWNNRDQLINNYNQLNYLNSGIAREQVIKIQEVTKEYLLFYKGQVIRYLELEEKISAENTDINKQYISLIAEEIIGRLHKYNQEYYHWYELPIGLLVGGLFYHIPLLNLFLIQKLREKNMEEEVIQFHTIILMLMHIDRVTIEIILEWLEYFAVIFKVPLEQLRNEIQNGEMEILEEIKQKVTYQPFIKIIENLQVSDRIGIEKAFDEVEMDRLNYQEKRKMENEMYIQDKASLGKVIAFIPFIITVGLYLILPFVIRGLTTFMGYMEQMNG